MPQIFLKKKTKTKKHTLETGEKQFLKQRLVTFGTVWYTLVIEVNTDLMFVV